MDTVRVRSVSPPERRKLRQWKRGRLNQVNRSRARIILLSSGGVCNREIARQVGYTPQWVRIVIHPLQRRRIDGNRMVSLLSWSAGAENVHRGRGRTNRRGGSFAAEGTHRHDAVVVGEIADLSDRAADHRRNQPGVVATSAAGFAACAGGIRRLGKNRTTRNFGPNTDACGGSTASVRSDGRRICVDKFGPLNLQPRHGGCWAGPGKRVERLRATYHRHGGVRHFLAAYDLETGRLFGQFTARKTWKEFLSFLRWLRRRYPKKQRLYVILDNYKPHAKTEVVAWAKTHKIKLIFTPTNASWLNRIECEFTALKKFSLDNSDHTTHEVQQDTIESYLQW